MFPGYRLYLTRTPEKNLLTPFSVIEEDDIVESSSEMLSSVPEIDGDAGSQKSLVDEPDCSSPLGASYTNTLLAFLVPFLLILGLILYTQPTLKEGHRVGCTVRQHLGLEQTQQVVDWQQLVNNSLVDTSMRNNGALPSADAIEPDAEARRTSYRDEVVRPQWEMFRDWVDYVLGWQEWQGYA